MAAAAALPLSIIALINYKCLSERRFALATESFHDYSQRPRNSHPSFKNLFGLSRPILAGLGFAAEKMGRRFPIERHKLAEG
jgi:hypothetical protein